VERRRRETPNISERDSAVMARASASERPRSSSVKTEAEAIDVVHPRRGSVFPRCVHQQCAPIVEDVAADGIAYLDGRAGARKLPGVARVAEVIENGFAEHF